MCISDEVRCNFVITCEHLLLCAVLQCDKTPGLGGGGEGGLIRISSDENDRRIFGGRRIWQVFFCVA